jgi:hypothetical protein
MKQLFGREWFKRIVIALPFYLLILESFETIEEKFGKCSVWFETSMKKNY